MTKRLLCPAVLLLAATTTLPVRAGSPSGRRAAAETENPPDVHFEVRTAGGRTSFAQGEPIPLELVFSSSSPDRYELDGATYDRSGRMHLEGFRLDPDDGAVDPLEAYFSGGVLMRGGIRSMPMLSSEPEVVELTLNEWLRFDRPGDYRLRVTTHRVRDLEGERMAGDRANELPPLVPLVSGVVELTIVPADPLWSARTLEEAIADLDANDEDVVRRACDRLRHLGTSEAVGELVRQFSDETEGCGFRAMLGLFAHPDRGLVVRRLEEHLLGAGAVNASLVQTLARLKWIAEHPVPAEEDEEARRARYRAQDEATRRLRSHYLARLASAVDDKEGTARAVSLATLVGTATSPSDSGAVRVEEAAALLAKHFHDLPPDKQVGLLEHRWDQLRGPAMLPVLRRLIEDPPEVSWIGGRQPIDLAVRRLFDLDRQAAREVVMAEILRPRPRLGREVLGLLPDRQLPPAVEASVIERLRTASPYGELAKIAYLLAHYGSPGVLEAVEAIYESERFRGHQTCWRAPFLAYFLRVDPSAGTIRLREAVALPEPGKHSACRAKRLTETASLHMSPELEAVAIELLDSEDSALRRAAAEVLREHGGPAAEAPLWRRLERWSATWKGRGEELKKPLRGEDLYVEERNFEWELIRALSQAASWVLGREDVVRLLELCVNPHPCHQAEILLLRLGEGDEVSITVYSLSPPRFQVAGYSASSLDALETRLGQFPQGTVFRRRLGEHGSEEERAGFVRRLESYLVDRGMGLVLSRAAGAATPD